MYVKAPNGLIVNESPVHIVPLLTVIVGVGLAVVAGTLVMLFIVIHSALAEVTVPPKTAIFVAVIGPLNVKVADAPEAKDAIVQLGEAKEPEEAADDEKFTPLGVGKLIVKFVAVLQLNVLVTTTV